MLKSILIPVLLTTTSVSYGACLPDATEIGDIGPASQLVCDMLEVRSPNSDITILDRTIESHNAVSVAVDINGRTELLNYRLTGADWRLAEPALAARSQ